MVGAEDIEDSSELSKENQLSQDGTKGKKKNKSKGKKKQAGGKAIGDDEDDIDKILEQLNIEDAKKENKKGGGVSTGKNSTTKTGKAEAETKEAVITAPGIHENSGMKF